jgi:hypothetical protein
MELQKVRRDCVTMKSKLDRLAKRQRATNASINSLSLVSGSPPTSSSSSSSSSDDTLSSSSRRRSSGMETEWRSSTPISWPEDPARKFNFRQIVRTRPSGGLLSSLGYGQPWLIQRAVSPAELHLPKHQFPPEMDSVAFAARGGLTLLITNFDDGFCSLTKFPRVRAVHVQLDLMASTACIHQPL